MFLKYGFIFIAFVCIALESRADSRRSDFAGADQAGALLPSFAVSEPHLPSPTIPEKQNQLQSLLRTQSVCSFWLIQCIRLYTG